MKVLPGAWLFLSVPLLFGQSDGVVRQAVEKQKERPNWFNTDPDVWPFAYQKTVTTIQIDGKGKVESKQSKTYDIVPITIPPLPWHYRHTTTLEIDGQPVTPEKDEARKTSEDFLAKMRRKVGDVDPLVPVKNSPKGQRILDDARRENILFWEEFQKAFQFPLLEHRELHGRPVTVFATRPDSAYRPNKDFSGSSQFARFTGEIWIDDAEVEIVRFKYQVNKDISGGPFGLLGKVYAGSFFQVDLTKQYKDLWLPGRTQAVLRYRKLLNSTRQEVIREFSNYREFITTATFSPEPADR